MNPQVPGVPVRHPLFRFLAVLMLPLALAAAPKPTTPAQLKAALKEVTAERDDLKDRLAATESLQADLVEAQKSRDLARQETAASRKELEQMKAALADNQGGTETILADLRKAKADAAACQAALEALKAEAEGRRQKGPASEGALVMLTPEITPAVAMNKVSPKRGRKAPKGVVVVNVLISEKGDVLDASIVQFLKGDPKDLEETHRNCVEAAKKLVFEPAMASDGKTRVRVWQGVGFLLD